MGGADIAAGKHQVGYISGVKAAEGNLVRHFHRNVMRGVAQILETLWVVVIHGPAAKRNCIIEGMSLFQILLSQNVFALIAATFPLARQETDPFQFPVFHAMVTVVLDMIPDTVSGLDQFFIDGLGIMDRVHLATQFDPPEVDTGADDVMIFQIHTLIIGICIGPFGGRKGADVVGFSGFNQAGRTHGAAVGNLRSGIFAEFLPTFPPCPIGRTAQLCQNAVTGAIHENRGTHGMEGIAVQLPAGDRSDFFSIHFAPQTGAVQQQGDIIFLQDHLVQHRIPHRVIHGGIPIDIFQFDFLQNTGFAVFLTCCATDPHSDFTGSVAAQNGPVMH